MPASLNLTLRTVKARGLEEIVEKGIADGRMHWSGEQLWQKCRSCEAAHPATTAFFHIDKGRVAGLSTECKTCKKKRSARYTEKPEPAPQAKPAADTEKPPRNPQQREEEASARDTRKRLEQEADAWVARLQLPIQDGFVFNIHTLRNAWRMPEPVIGPFLDRLKEIRAQERCCADSQWTSSASTPA